MATMSKTAFGIAAGVCGTLFLGYCLYFDSKRRADPNFKKKLRDRRRANKEAGRRAGTSKFPNWKDHESVQKFFLQEIQQGELMLANGDVEQGIEHLCNALSVCGQANQLLQVLQQTLPPQIFQMLIQKLPTHGQRIMSQSQEMGSGLEEDDVE